MRQLIATALLVLTIFLLSGCTDSPVGPPRTAADGTTFQDMSSGNTVITHPNGSISVAPNK